MKTSAFALLASALVTLAVAVAAPCRAAAAGPPPTPVQPVLPVVIPPAASCPAAADMAKLSVDQPVAVVAKLSAARQALGASSVPPTPPNVRPVVALHDQIAVHVAGLATLLAREKCSLSSGKIVLFLDGRPLPSVTPFPPLDPASETLQFVLDRSDVAADAPSRDAWTHLLGRSSLDPHAVKVSVGLQNDYPLRSDWVVQLQTIPAGGFWAWVVLLALLICFFLALAVRSDVLRDIGPQPTSNARKPYSLAKMQAAWWFFLILASYLFIGLVSGDYGTTITGTVLSLMGISAATAVASATIDVSRPAGAGADAGAGAGAAAAAAAAAAAGVAVPAATVVSETKGHWWLDILSDDHGVNFHRFQMATWTLVLGVIFVHEVYAGLAMPVFDNTLLGLLGISSGTYLGLKTTGEKS